MASWHTDSKTTDDSTALEARLHTQRASNPTTEDSMADDSQDGIADIAATAKTLRVPMTHVPTDNEYLEVLAYRVGQQIEAAEFRLANLRNLHARIERIAPEVV